MANKYCTHGHPLSVTEIHYWLSYRSDIIFDPLTDEILLFVTCFYDILRVIWVSSTQVQVVSPILNHHGNQRGGH